ncbi:MAG: aminotransferase class I/II-fold pyridoxal phosphate-dependent enzyme [Ginsengibacter sp.]
MITTAKRLNGIGEYYFSKKLQEIQEINKGSVKVINLGIGSPDLPPHPEVINTLQEETAKHNVHGYQNYKGVEALRNAFSQWYSNYYGVILDASSEVLPLIGSKEGIMHICMTYLNEGDEALIPNPGYPTYSAAVQLAGGKCITYDLDEQNNWQINFEDLEKKDLSKVKIMWVNYPHMPTGTNGSASLFDRIVGFGKKHNILICHDNPYSFILSDKPISILSADGAKDIVIELNSLSKSHNMPGWRVGVLTGNSERIKEVLTFKSNMDSGMFLPVQIAAAKALSLPASWYTYINNIYRERKEKAFQLLDLINCSYKTDQTGLFVWARISEKYSTGFELSDFILNKSKVFITPGGIFGSAGDKYVRVSLCSSIEQFDESIERIKNI